MRLIHSVHRPAKICFFRQLQQCQINKTSNTRLHPVLIEASNLAHGSNIQWHVRPYSASASSDPMEAKKPRRRVPKNERKSMVENYVKKYREANAGKFPTASDAMKDVGGSYYVVRQILQELMHNSKQSPVDAKETLLEKSAIGKDEISINIGEISQTRELGEIIRPILKEDIRKSSSKVLKSKQRQQSSISVEIDESKDVGTQSHLLIDKPECSQHPDRENNIKQEKLEDRLKFDGVEHKAGLQESTEISKRELHKVPTGDVEPQKESSVWNSLKSFANGILSIWKRA